MDILGEMTRERGELMEGELIKVEPVRIGGRDVFCVSARDVHGKLEVGNAFSPWIKGRIAKYSYTEGKDYVVSLSCKETSPLGGRPPVEYMLTTDMALDLALIEGTAAALEFKRALVAQLDAARKAPAPVSVIDLVEGNLDLVIALAQKAKAEQEERLRLEAKVAEDAPIVEHAMMCMARERNMGIYEFAAELMNDGDIKTAGKRFMDWLKAEGYVCKAGRRETLPTRKAKEPVLLMVSEREESADTEGRVWVHRTARITPQGQVFFRARYRAAKGLPLSASPAGDGLKLVPSPTSGGLFTKT
jgi:phage antirepressor YoqD-like protein/phage anti-repressor protein